MKRLLIAVLLLTACVAWARPFSNTRMGGESRPGFAPMQRGSVAAAVEQPAWSSATYALSLDGVDDYAVSVASLPAGAATVTYMCWYYDAVPTSGLTAVFSYSSLVFGLGYPSADKAFAGNQTGFQCFDPATRAAEWKHGAMVRPGYADSVAPADCRFYVNGSASAKVAGSFGETAGQALADRPLFVGRYQAGLEWPFKGKIAEVAIFNIALTQAEIQGYYLKRLTGTEPGLVRLYHCDEGSGTTIADACGSGDSLTLANGATWTTRLTAMDKRVATAVLSLDGVDDYAISSFTAPAGVATVTMMAWVYDAEPSGSLRVAFSYTSWAVGLGYPDNSYAFLGDAQQGIAAFASPRAGEWKHIAFVKRDGQTDAQSLMYFNASETAYSGTRSGVAVAMNPTYKIYAGKAATWEYYLKGKIAEIAVFDIALTQAQIQGYYRNGLTGTEPGLIRLWHCDEGSGTTIADACGSGDVLTLTNGATWTTKL